MRDAWRSVYQTINMFCPWEYNSQDTHPVGGMVSCVKIVSGRNDKTQSAMDQEEGEADWVIKNLAPWTKRNNMK